jgi:hypothetical protein
MSAFNNVVPAGSHRQEAPVTTLPEDLKARRVTTAQKIAIVSPTKGTIVYDTTLNKLCVFTTAWETITSS